MSISAHLVGFSPPDSEWKAKRKVYDACVAAKVKGPEEVQKFFDWREPDENGVEVEIEDTPAVKEWKSDCQEGYEVEIAKLPANVKVVRFYVGY